MLLQPRSVLEKPLVLVFGGMARFMAGKAVTLPKEAAKADVTHVWNYAQALPFLFPRSGTNDARS